MMKKFLYTLPVLFLAGCVSVLPKSGDLPPRLRLDPDVSITALATQLDTALIISDPTAESVYNTFNVAVATGPYKYEYIEGAEWTDRVPVLFRIYLERRFENAAIATAVGDRTEMTLSASYTIFTDIRAFNIDRTGSEEIARVSFGSRLTGPRGKTLGTEVFTREIPIRTRNIDNYARAINEAAAAATDENIAWAAGLMAAEEAKRNAGSVEVTGG